MSGRHAYCCANTGNCPAAAGNPYRRSSWYHRLVKPVAFCVVTSLLSMSISHLCDKYSASTSFGHIRDELNDLRMRFDVLSTEVKTVIDTRDELDSKLEEIGCVIPKIPEALSKLRDEVSKESIRNTIRSELETYDADKTGRTDYALESSGGQILSTRDTETYTAGAPVLTLFGMPLCQQQNTPRAVIQSGVLPGECWAFKGSTGSVVVQLLGPVHVSGVSLEHISPAISPTGETTTAPRQFSIWGLECVDDTDGFLFGEFTYYNDGVPVQYFEVQNQSRKAYEIVELKVHSNSGNPEYTCVYRIRVHGTLER